MNAKVIVPVQASAPAAVEPALRSSDEFADRYFTERELLRADARIQLLPERWLPSTSAFLGGSGIPVGSFRFVTHDEQGRPRPELSRTRYDTKNKDERYRNAPGSGCVLYAPDPDAHARFASATVVAICEGEAKTLAIKRAGIAALGIGGIQNWRGQDGNLLPAFAKLRAGTIADLYVDGDCQTNKDVHKGTFLLMTELRAIGIKVRLVVLPEVPGLDKTGIDDLIATWRRAGLNVTDQLARLQRLEEIPNPFVVDFKDPLATAENFLAARYSHPLGQTLVHWQDDFYEWKIFGWQRYPEELLRETLYYFIKEQKERPTKGQVDKILDALRAAAQINVREAPCWLGANAPSDLLPLANGLLNLSTGALLPPTPQFFNLSWSDVPYAPEAICPRWLQFLGEVYPNDTETQQCLQEFLGYSLTEDTSQQKAIALIGAKRSGKGTIARVLRALVGRTSCCEPTLQSMGERFGLQTWIGKKVAIVSDARTSVRNNAQAMVERVLTVTGEDAQYVDRKHLEPWEGRLRVRLWMLSNMLPATNDTGAALVSRFLVLNHSVSFYGREDTGLEEALEEEHSGILNWALAGLHRLRKRGRFVQPQAGEERIKDWERQNSPVLAFVQDRCELGSGLFVTKDALRNAYTDFAEANNITHIPSMSHFTEELKAATEGKIEAGQRTVRNMKGTRVFVGIALIGDGRKC